MIFLEILAAILVAIGLTLAVLSVIGKSREQYEEPAPVLADWMSRVADSAPLNQIAIPGSHDAGTAGVIWAGETQTYTIEQQLLCGARYFDLRVHKKDGTFRIFHALVDGVEFLPILNALKQFLLDHPTETLLLDFQHFKGDSQRDVFRLLRDTLGDMIAENVTDLPDPAFIRSLTLGDVRGKCLIFWGDRSENFSPRIFLRNDNECTFDGMSLDSYYIAPLHRAGTQALLGKAHPIYLARMRRLKEEGVNGIFVFQCQLTDGLIVRGPWSRERRHDPIVTDYINGLKNSPDLADLNVIMRDFLKPRKCADIIDLNVAKGWMEKEI